MTGSPPQRELLERAQGGDRAAFDRLVEEHADALEYFVRLRLGQRLRRRTEVEDVLQESKLRALRSLARFSWTGDGSFLGWLQAIAEHVILESARNERRHPAGGIVRDEAGDQASLDRVLQRQERFVRLQRAFDSLAPDHRKVILLARLQKLPLRVVAERMGRSPEAVKQLLWRALKQLRGRFGETDSLRLPDARLGDRERGDG